MKKLIKGLCLLLITSCICLMCAVVYGFYALPDNIHSLCNEKLDIGFLYTCTVDGKEKAVSKSFVAEGEYSVNLKLLNTIPVKKSSLTVNSRPYVVPSGEIVGLRIFTEGVLIVGSEDVQTDKGNVNPAKNAGLSKGDVITRLGSEKVSSTSQVEKIIRECNGNALQVEYKRDGKNCATTLLPVYCTGEGKYKTGLWIRDSAAGIGTMTFYDKQSGFFACLGHGVCDADTGQMLPFSHGDIVDATISGCVKGKQGCAGELCGSFKSNREGILFMNDSMGAFGYFSSKRSSGDEIPVAAKSEVKTGKAYIISTVEGETKEYFDVEIEKLNPYDRECKHMVIKITDSRLIGKTGGIVQGMSGSPIIQNGYLVGAVTHVFVNDPTKGYGILAESMIQNATEQVAQAG